MYDACTEGSLIFHNFLCTIATVVPYFYLHCCYSWHFTSLPSVQCFQFSIYHNYVANGRVCSLMQTLCSLRCVHRFSKRCDRATLRSCKIFQRLRKIWVFEPKNAQFITVSPFLGKFCNFFRCFALFCLRKTF